ncbi:MAG: hypothetical protein R3D88_07405 [Alphaproteobacteria bacterium]|nr:hypothetical protein [Alphaproteobacteria bacterium]
MLHLNQTKTNKVVVNPVIFQMQARQFLSFVDGLVRTLQKNAQETVTQLREQADLVSKSSHLKPEFDRADLRQKGMKMCMMIDFAQKAFKVVGQLAEADKEKLVSALNELSSQIISEQVETNQPEEHINKMVDLIGYEFVEHDEELFNPIEYKERANDIIRNIAIVLTTGAPTTLAKANANGASFEDLLIMQQVAKDFQKIVVEVYGKMTKQSSGPTSDWSPA